MNITPSEAEEALTAIQSMMEKTRRSLSSSGAYKFLILWGVIWMLGFIGSQFFPAEVAQKLWIGLDILGGFLSAVIGMHEPWCVHPSQQPPGSALLSFGCYSSSIVSLLSLSPGPWMASSSPCSLSLFVTVGWIAMGLLLSFASVWWGLGLLALSLVGYFLLPDIFYLWMAVLGGGGMIALGVYVKNRW
jgi:hypothetical protein